jgi:hypothetical protein
VESLIHSLPTLTASLATLQSAAVIAGCDSLRDNRACECYVTIQARIAGGERDAPTTRQNNRPTHCPSWNVGTVQVHPEGL